MHAVVRGGARVAGGPVHPTDERPGHAAPGRPGRAPDRPGLRHPRRHLPRGRHQLCGERRAQAAVEYDAHRRAIGQARQAAGEIGVVRQHRAGAHYDRIVPRPQGVALSARRFTRDPFGLAGAGGNAAIQGTGNLQRHQRTLKKLRVVVL